jgi:hypothetical protein
MSSIRHAGALALVGVFTLSDGRAAGALTTVSSPPVTRQVVSEDTAAPLSDVEIFAFWVGNKRVPMAYSDTVKIVEAKSRADGTFTLPAWGPLTIAEPLSQVSPIILCFLSGFEPALIELPQLSPAELTGPIRLRRLDGERDAQARALALVTWHLAYAVAPLDGPSRPRMLSVAEAAWRRLPKDLTKNRPDLIVGFDWWVQEFRRAFKTKSWEQR